MRKAKRSRRKALAKRQPNGHIRPEPKSITVAEFRRQVRAASLIAADPLLGCQLGWLARSRRITQEQLDAGLRMPETYGRYDLAMGCRRNAASPSYEIGRRGAAGSGGEAEAERDRGAVAAYEQMAAVLGRCERRAVKLAERLCVDDEHLMDGELCDAARVLDALSAHFAGHHQAHAGKLPHQKAAPSPQPAIAASAPPAHPIDVALAALAPNMNPTARAELRAELRARIDRAKFEARKSRKPEVEPPVAELKGEFPMLPAARRGSSQ